MKNKMKNKVLNATDELIKSVERCKKMEDALSTILLNTLHRNNFDPMYKLGVIANIRMALGDEKFNYYKELYS